MLITAPSASMQNDTVTCFRIHFHLGLIPVTVCIEVLICGVEGVSMKIIFQCCFKSFNITNCFFETLREVIEHHPGGFCKRLT
jgi:hypothetical protein